MVALRTHVENIIQELTRLQEVPVSNIDKDDKFPFPRMIAAGDGGSIIVSRKIDQAILLVADQLVGDDPTLARKYTNSEWRWSVRGAFGPALAKIDLDDDPAESADAVLANIRATLGKQVSGHGLREFAFGCTLFDNKSIKPFTIGPVQFESRIDWLARKHRERGISTVIRRRLEQAWQGKRLRKRMPSRSSISEADILGSVGSCDFVGSVATNGLAAEAGLEKALTAARLAMASIALLWQTPSKALEGMNLLIDRRPHVQMLLTFVPDRGVLSGSRWSNSHHGPRVGSGDWETMLAQRSEFFSLSGNLLDYVVSPTGAVARPKMMNALAQSLLWFYEGCRETVNLMAIVKFSAALDALACGGKAAGIRRLINKRLNIQDSSPIRPDGPTLIQAIDEIYSRARSRTIHGTNEKLGHDWSGTRGLAEQFARLCLIVCIDWATSNRSSDDPLQLSRSS